MSGPSTSKSRPPKVVLVTGFLGIPVANASKHTGEAQRFDVTLIALQRLRSQSSNFRILLAFTGDPDSLQRLVSECNWPSEDAACFPQSPESIPFGKGLLEHQLITGALEHWGLAQVDAHVLKLTAKYTVRNLDHVLDFFNRCELPVYGWRHLGKRMIDTRCFFFRARAYKYMTPTMNVIDDRTGYYIEHAMYDVLYQLDISPGLLNRRPLLFGLSGSTGEHIEPAFWKLMLVYLTSFIKRFGQ